MQHLIKLQLTSAIKAGIIYIMTVKLFNQIIHVLTRLSLILGFHV